jgi:hypothetical protein
LRAARAVIQEYGQQIEDAIRNKLFTGQADQALDAFRQARQAYSTHASLFNSQYHDQGVGRAIEQITARNGYAGSTPTEIANMLYGQSRVGAGGQSARLAERIRDIVGEESPAWAAVKQGLFSRLVEATEGIADRGPKVIADRIFEFLNGSGAPISQTMFSPRERQAMEQYARLMRQITVPQAGANWSNTSTGMRLLINHGMGTVMAALGHAMVGPLGIFGGYAAHGADRAAAHAIRDRSAAGSIARSLYMTPAQQQAEARLGEQLGRHGAPIAAAIRAGVHPAAALGGKRADDGNFYVADPARPGFYLRIDDRRAGIGGR